MHSPVRKAPRRAPRVISRLADGGPVTPPMPAAPASPAATPTPTPAAMGPSAAAAPAAVASSGAAPSNMLTDPANIAARNASVQSVFPSRQPGPGQAAAGPSAAAAPKDPFDHSSVDLLDPSNIAARNASVHSVFPTPGASSAAPRPAGAMPPPSIAAQDAARLASSQFGMADGGIVPAPTVTPAAQPVAQAAPPVAPVQPAPPPPAPSPYSILGIARGVAGAYNGAVDHTANAMLAVHNTFARPGFTPPTPAPAPVAAAPVAAPAAVSSGLPQLGGLNLTVLQRREAAAGLANGGMVKRGAISRLASGGVISGPGTGTSDSIPASMKPGSYVVPADTTQQVKSTPVNVSNGETAMTPEDVHALGTAALSSPDDPHAAGIAALDVLKKVTHRNVHAGRRGKANGGPVSALTSIGAPFSARLERTAGPAIGVRAVLHRAEGGPIYGSQLAAQIPTDIPPPIPAPAAAAAPAPAAAPVAAVAAPQAPATATMGDAAPGPVSSLVAGAPGVVKVVSAGAPPLYTNIPGGDPSMGRGPISAQNQQAMDNLAAKYDQQAVRGAATMGPSAAANLPGLAGAWIPGITAPASQGQQEIDARNAQMTTDDANAAALRGGRNAISILNNENTNATTLASQGMQQAGATQRTGISEGGANQRAQLQNDTEMQLRGPLTGIAVQEAGQKMLQGQQAMAAQKAYQEALAGGDPKAIDNAEMALRGQTGHLPMRYEAGTGGTMGADTLHNLAIQYLGGDHSVVNGLGGGAMGSMNRAALMQAVTQEMSNRGMTPEQINAKKSDFASEMAGASTAGKRQANLDMAATEAAQSFDLVRQASANVSRTQFVPLNQALNSFRNNTGDPHVVALGAATNALMNEYARAVAGGAPTVNDKQHAEALLNTAQTQQQQDAVLNMMQREIEFARNSPKMIQQERAQRLGAGPMTGAAPAATPGASPTPAPAAPAARTTVRTGTVNGRRVTQYSDGSISYAD